jgi:hypothetical protein
MALFMKLKSLNPLCFVRNDIQNRIIEYALTQNRKAVTKKFKVKIKGFADLNKVPLKHLIHEYLKVDLCSFTDSANVLLKIWYNGRVELREFVHELLKKNNYEPVDPNFESEQYYFKAFREEDVTKNENQSYFAPKGVTLDPFDPEEVTLMALLLGWDVDENNTKDNDGGDVMERENIQDHISSIEQEVKQLTSIMKNCQNKLLKGEVYIVLNDQVTIKL